MMRRSETNNNIMIKCFIINMVVMKYSETNSKIILW